MTTVADIYNTYATEEWDTYARTAQHWPENLPENAKTFNNTDEIRRYVASTGSHYFDADAIKFFRAKSDTQLFGRRFWVESRKYSNRITGESWAREYQVAWVAGYSGQGFASIEKLGNFDTLAKARRVAKLLANTI